MSKDGRLSLVKTKVLERCAGHGREGLTVGEVAEAVKASLVKTKHYSEFGGTSETVLPDCRRALSALRDDGHAEFRGVKAVGRWHLSRRRKAA